jgi:thiamine biosynthesis protein ThiS
MMAHTTVNSRAARDKPGPVQLTGHRGQLYAPTPVTITLNGEPFSVPESLTITDLLVRLEIDPRRVAVERNIVVVKRAAYDTTQIVEGDEIEIVNFVGGG